jgi:hypothetical protein
MPKLPLIIAYMFLACDPFLVYFLPTQLCLGCNQIFQFAPCAPHRNHPNYLHSTMGAHLLCLESQTHHNLQFGLKGFKRLLPSMVQSLPFSSINFSKIWPIVKFSPTSSPPMWSNAPYPFVDKGHQTIAISLCLNPKFCIQTISKTL